MPHSTATAVYSRESHERTIERIEEIIQENYHCFHNRFQASPISVTEKIKILWERSNWFNRKKIKAAKRLALKKKKPYYRIHERW